MEGDEENVASSSPQVEMRYYVDPARPLMGVVRAIGVMALLFGILSLVTLPLNLMYDRSQRSASPQDKSGWIVFNERLWPFVTVVQSSCLVVAGGACLRRRPRGAGLLIVWAWWMVAWVAYAMVVNGWYLLGEPRGRYSAIAIAYSLGYYLQHWIAGLVLPVVVIFVMRTGAVRALFDPEEDVRR